MAYKKKIQDNELICSHCSLLLAICLGIECHLAWEFESFAYCLLNWSTHSQIHQFTRTYTGLHRYDKMIAIFKRPTDAADVFIIVVGLAVFSVVCVCGWVICITRSDINNFHPSTLLQSCSFVRFSWILLCCCSVFHKIHFDLFRSCSWCVAGIAARATIQCVHPSGWYAILKSFQFTILDVLNMIRTPTISEAIYDTTQNLLSNWRVELMFKIFHVCVL